MMNELSSIELSFPCKHPFLITASPDANVCLRCGCEIMFLLNNCRARNAFMKWDVNNDGKISERELLSVLSCLNC